MSQINPVQPSFDRIPVNFQYSGEEWSRMNLPAIRIAVSMCIKNSDEVRSAIRVLQDDDPALVDDMITSIEIVREHLQGVVDILEVAERRIRLTMEKPVLATAI